LSQIGKLEKGDAWVVFEGSERGHVVAGFVVGVARWTEGVEDLTPRI